MALVALFAAWLMWLLQRPPRPSEWLVAGSGLPVLLLVSWTVARTRGQTWLDFLRASADVHVVAGALLYGFGVQFADAHGLGITTDGTVYFAQLRSLVFDGDLDVAREFEYLQQPARPNHVVPVGPTLVWMPLYLTVSIADAAGRGLGWWPGPAEPIALGLGPAYVRAALVSSYVVAAAGLLVLHLHLRARFSRGAACVATLLVLGATPLYWYMVYEPSMTHAVSFGFVAFFVVCAARWVPRGTTRRQGLMLGGLLGLAFLTRPQEALFALYPACMVLSMTTPSSSLRPRIQAAFDLARWGFLGALPCLVVQALHSYVLFAREEYRLLGGAGYLHPFSSRWVDTLFSSWHGFLAWSPVAYLAVVGLLLLVRRDWRWALSGLAIFLAMAWVNGSTQDWAAGWAFGGRRFTSTLVMLAAGLACLTDIARRRPMLAVAPLAAGALVWNHYLMVQYTAGMLPKDAPVSFARMVRQQAELATRPPYFYPFAFPANAWFALREDLPVDRYDLLAPLELDESFDLTFDGRATGFLLEGWDAPGGDDWGPCWWVGNSPATVTVPLSRPARGELQIEIVSRTRLDEPPVRASLALDINGFELGTFAAGVPEPSTARFTIPAADVSRGVRTGFNTVSLRSLGVAPLDETRAPASLARTSDRTVWPVAIYRLIIRPVSRGAP